MDIRKLALAASLMASVAVPALAQNPEPLRGWYMSIGAGPNWAQNQHFNSSIVRPVTSALDTSVGFTTVIAGGYALQNGLRFEIEGDYRRNSIEKASNLPFAANTNGTIQKYGVMVNALFDVSNYIPVPWVQPYIGAGVGYSWNQLNNVRIVQTPTGFPNFHTGGTQGSFAYQAILGAAYPIVSVRGLALTAEYRFFGTASADYDITAIPARTSTAPVRGTAQLGSSYNHSIMIGLRYNFLPPPPPPPVAPVVPAPAPTRSYMVFFDWDKYALTDRAKQIVAEAAQNSTKVQHTRIEVNGYTDTSGTPKYNLGLSMRRAKAVEAELVRNGVAQSDIGIQGFGDTNLLVPTGPGVREPQNRRVEIILR